MCLYWQHENKESIICHNVEGHVFWYLWRMKWKHWMTINFSRIVSLEIEPIAMSFVGKSITFWKQGKVIAKYSVIDDWRKKQYWIVVWVIAVQQCVVCALKNDLQLQSCERRNALESIMLLAFYQNISYTWQKTIFCSNVCNKLFFIN